jgi:hypothetical protein
VVYGREVTQAAVRAAVRAQTLSPRHLGEASSLTEAVGAAQRVECRWVWLLDGLAVPREDALEALLAAYATASPPPPVLLASKVVDPCGRLHPAAWPRHEIFEKQHSVEAAERGMVQLRAAAAGSLLVSRGVLDRFAPPRSDLPAGLDLHEWTARILRSWEDTGYLVTASVAVRSDHRRSTEPGLLPRLRVLGSPAWRPRERLWEGFLLGRSALRRVSARVHEAAHGRDGVGAPGLTPSHSPRRTVPITLGARWLARR